MCFTLKPYSLETLLRSLVHRGGFEPPYLLRGTDLQSVGFNHSPTCANPKTPRHAKSHTGTAQHLSAREANCENARLTTTLAGKYREGVLESRAVSARHRASPRKPLLFPESFFSGAGEGNRTPDPLITNQMLYQLSYASPNFAEPENQPPQAKDSLAICSPKHPADCADVPAQSAPQVSTLA